MVVIPGIGGTTVCAPVLIKFSRHEFPDFPQADEHAGYDYDKLRLAVDHVDIGHIRKIMKFLLRKKLTTSFLRCMARTKLCAAVRHEPMFWLGYSRY